MNLLHLDLPSDISLVVLDMVLELWTLVTASMFDLLLGKFSWDLVPLSIYQFISAQHCSTNWVGVLIYNSIKFNSGHVFWCPRDSSKWGHSDSVSSNVVTQVLWLWWWDWLGSDWSLGSITFLSVVFAKPGNTQEICY